MKSVKKNLITVFAILMLILISGLLIVQQVNAEEFKYEIYETVEDYLKVYHEGYENLEKDQITSIFLDSLDRCSIKDFSGLYEYPNLTELRVWGFSPENAIDLSKISKLQSLTISISSINNWGIEKLINLGELHIGYVYMEEGESLNLDLSKFSNLSSLHIEELDGDLSNVTIDLRQRSETLADVQIGLSIDGTKNFSIKNTILVKDNYYFTTNIYEGNIKYHWSLGMGGPGAIINCDTLENYLSNFYPGISKENITEIDFEKWGSTYIDDLTGLNDLVNLKKATLSNINDWSKIDLNKLSYLEELTLKHCGSEEVINLNDLSNLRKLSVDANYVEIGYTKVDISNLKKLEEFEYLFEDYGNKDSQGNSHLPKLRENIITNDYSKIEYKEIVHVDNEGEEEFIWYEKIYYFANKESYISSNSELKETNIGGKEVIKGLPVTNNNVTIKELLDSKAFIEDVEVKIFDSNDKEVVDKSKNLATGNVIKLYKNEKVVKEYKVVIYGDTTGDGKITAVDALALIKHINNKILFTDEVYSEAGRVRETSGETLTAVDALAIIKGVNGKFTINQYK